MRFDIFNRLDVHHKCDREADGWTDRQTDRTAVSAKNVIKRHLQVTIA